MAAAFATSEGCPDIHEMGGTNREPKEVCIWALGSWAGASPICQISSDCGLPETQDQKVVVAVPGAGWLLYKVCT